MAEKILLIFEDGSRYEWKTNSIRSCIKATKMRKKHGDPMQIIGKGVVAQTLRAKYQIYNQNKREYKLGIFETASKLSGKTKEELETKMKKISKRLRIKTE